MLVVSSCLMIASLLGVAVRHQRELTLTTTRATEHAAHLTATLSRERQERKREAAERARAPECSPAALAPASHASIAAAPPPSLPLTAAAVRAMVRRALNEVATGLQQSSDRGISKKGGDRGGDRGGDARDVEDGADVELDHAELVRVELAEGLALEDSGWCDCPPPPDFARLCRALSRQEGADASREALISRVRALEGSLDALSAHSAAQLATSRAETAEARAQLEAAGSAIAAGVLRCKAAAPRGSAGGKGFALVRPNAECLSDDKTLANDSPSIGKSRKSLNPPHLSHMSHPILRIWHTPFFAYVTPHSSHMAHPSLPHPILPHPMPPLHHRIPSFRRGVCRRLCCR